MGDEAELNVVILKVLYYLDIFVEHSTMIMILCTCDKYYVNLNPTRKHEINLFGQLFHANVVFNPLTAGVAYIRFLIFYYHIKYHILNMLKIKCDINQQDLKRIDLLFVKSE